MDIQSMVDSLNQAMKEQRAQYHLTLGALIEEMRAEPNQHLPVVLDYNKERTLGALASYRGHYSDLAFSERIGRLTVWQLLPKVAAALDGTFEGYKGGDFTMDAGTPLWVSEYGEASGIAIMGAQRSGGAFVIVTKRIA